MTSGKRPPLPLILSANAVLDGDVVYRIAGGWSGRLSDAVVAQDDEEAAQLGAAQQAAERSGEVIGAELVSVSFDAAGRIVPAHYRERIRALGPTVRPDLGPQGRGEHVHVSL
jgi:hypothetical protein